MSEPITNRQHRQEALKRMIRQLHEGRTVDEVKGEFAALLQDVGAAEIAELEQALINEGLPEMEVKRLCDVHVAAFRESLDAQPRPELTPGHPVHTFRAENAAAGLLLERLAQALSALQAEPTAAHRAEALELLRRLREYDRHYLRKEHLLFPYLERHGFTGPSSVMWAIHDDVRAGWKALDARLTAAPGDDPAGFAAQIAEIFTPLATAIRQMFFKEETILFPTAVQMLSEEEWRAIRSQETEIGYFVVQPGNHWPPEIPAPAIAEPTSPEGLIFIQTGALTVQQLDLLFDCLPLEISFVDQDDTVRFFTQADERIFQRSPAIIGRKVQKCHPPASVHRVQRILDDFRAGRRDVAEFWLQTKGRFIYIRYFALRDGNGQYQGTVEVVQDVTHIRALEGERRLLDEG